MRSAFYNSYQFLNTSSYHSPSPSLPGPTELVSGTHMAGKIKSYVYKVISKEGQGIANRIMISPADHNYQSVQVRTKQIICM